MEEMLPKLVGIKKAAEIVGCSDKVIRNYIGAGKIFFQRVDSPYGDQYEVDPDEVSKVYNSRRTGTVEFKKVTNSTGTSTHENIGLKEILPAMERFRVDYKEAMERLSGMSYELGIAQKEVKLLTGDSLEKGALEKQILALREDLATLKVKNEHLIEKAEQLQVDKSSLQVEKERLEEANSRLQESLEIELRKTAWQKFRGQ